MIAKGLFHLKKNFSSVIIIHYLKCLKLVSNTIKAHIKDDSNYTL